MPPCPSIRKGLNMYEVYVAEYMGEGYWHDYPPYTFNTLKEAMEFADTQKGPRTKVRGIKKKNS